MFRKIRLLLIILLAAGVPYAWFGGLLSGAQSKLVSLWNGFRSRATFSGLDFTAPGGPPATKSASAARPEQPIAARLTGAPVTDLEDVLRFDVQPAWITTRWTRVSTVLSEQQFQGLRVPLVTGTDLGDLAGSLTYYFDQQRQVRRITFTGRTGEPQRLVDLVTARFGFVPVADLGAGVYLVRWNGQPTCALRISHAPVVRSEEPLAQFDVQLELNRPDMSYQLSPQFEEMLTRDRHVRRW